MVKVRLSFDFLKVKNNKITFTIIPHKKLMLINKNRKCRTQNYLITHLNNLSFPLNGGYFIDGSNQVGVFITAFL